MKKNDSKDSSVEQQNTDTNTNAEITDVKNTSSDIDNITSTNNTNNTNNITQKVKLPSRHNLQLGRRLFHLVNGATIATMYNLFWEHSQVVYIIGLGASLIYIAEQIRLAYPDFASKLSWFSNFLLRAEEELKESAAIPYAMALLLTIISFPKTVAIIAIYTLSISDPLSAIIGITYGKKKLAKNKSLEGSSAFFISTFAICFLVLITSVSSAHLLAIFKASFLIAFIVSAFELIPLRLDDNLTIPLFTAVVSWPILRFVGIPL
ncbi:MAG: hypothetical protein HQK49_06715 [Oligoflexia bacterium]|nr:hypothetical protein [Oligoflexia bacterium]